RRVTRHRARRHPVHHRRRHRHRCGRPEDEQLEHERDEHETEPDAAVQLRLARHLHRRRIGRTRSRLYYWTAGAPTAAAHGPGSTTAGWWPSRSAPPGTPPT